MDIAFASLRADVSFFLMRKEIGVRYAFASEVQHRWQNKHEIPSNSTKSKAELWSRSLEKILIRAKTRLLFMGKYAFLFSFESYIFFFLSFNMAL